MAYVVEMDGKVYGPFSNPVTADQWIKQMYELGVRDMASTMPVVSPRMALKQAAGEEPPVQRVATVCLECGGVGKCKGQKKHRRVWMKDGVEYINKKEYDPAKEKMSRQMRDRREYPFAQSTHIEPDRIG